MQTGLGFVLIMFTGRISLKRSICFALCDFVLYLCVFTNDNKQPALAPLICTMSRVTEADTVFDVLPFISLQYCGNCNRWCGAGKYK